MRLIPYFPRKVNGAIKRLYPRYGLIPSDVLLPSFPKSGNTWMRFIWANIINIEERDGEEADFGAINGVVGSEYDLNIYASYESEILPRLVKTHMEYSSSRFRDNRAVYLIRHPGDVMLSYFDYRKARRSSRDEAQSLSHFLRNEQHGVPAWGRHVKSWLAQDPIVIRYEDLKRDAEAEVLDMFRQLGEDHVPEDSMREAVRRSAFDNMKRIESEQGLEGDRELDDDFTFVRKGAPGAWYNQISDEDRDYIVHMIAKQGFTDLYPSPTE